MLALALLLALGGAGDADMATEQERLQLIYQIARKAGLDDEGARVAVAIARTEGGLSGAVGDNGASFGPFQFYTGGQLPNYAKARGLSVQQAGQKARTDIEDAAEWALTNYLGAKIKEGQQKGLSGSALATYAQRYGQVSVNPEKAGQNYAALYGQGGSGPTGGTMPTPTADVDKKQPDKPDYLGGLQGRLEEYKTQLREIENRWKAASAEEAAAKGKVAIAQGRITDATKSLDLYDPDPATKAAAQQRLQVAVNEREQATADYTAAKERREQIEQERTRLFTDRSSTQGRIDAETLRLQQISQDLKDNYLDDQLKLINAGIAAGNLDARQADDQWKQVLAQANAILTYEMNKSKEGMAGVDKGYDLFLRGAGRMGTQADADALADTMRGWGPILGREVTPVQMGVQPFTPREDMARYAPPAPDWQAAQQALTSLNQFQPSAGGGGPIDVNARLAEAQGYLDQQGREPQGAVGTGGPPMGPQLSPRAGAEMPNEAAYDSLPPEAQGYVRSIMEQYMADAERRKRDSMQQALTGGEGRTRSMLMDEWQAEQNATVPQVSPLPLSTESAQRWRPRTTPTAAPSVAPSRTPTATPVPSRTPMPASTPPSTPAAIANDETLTEEEQQRLIDEWYAYTGS